MKTPPLPANESARLNALHHLRILDTEREDRFDRITRIAKNYFQVPIALISLVDGRRQWFKSRQGLAATETHKNISFCGHAILSDRTFVVSDTFENVDFCDNPLVTGDPSIRFYAGAPLHAPGGERVGTLCIIDKRPRDIDALGLSVLRDLADCVETELSLTTVREHGRFLHEIADAMPGMVAYWDKDLVCRFANRAYLEWFGKAPEAVIGDTLQNLLGQRLFALNEPHARGALAGEAQRFERTLTKADGTTGYTWAHYLPDKTEDGVIVGFVVLVSDVTPFKEAESKVREAELSLQAILENINDGIVTLGRDGVIVSANRAMTEVFHYSTDEMVGRNVALLIPELSAGSGAAGFFRDRLASKKRFRSDFTGRDRDGQSFPIEFSLSEMTIGDRLLFVGAMKDVTERVLAVEAMQHAKQAAEAANAAKDRFLATVSHEIRTPITAVLGMADLLLGSGLNAEQQRWLQQLTRSTETLLDLINDILDFSKIEAGHVELENLDFSLPQLVREACLLFAPLASEKGTIIEVKVDPTVREVYHGDAKKFRQILMNLMGNANKFTTKGKILVSVRKSWDEDGRDIIETCVSDTGIGIAMEDRGRLFEPFIQEDVSTSRKFGGTGLGLSICKSLVELMGGHIWVESHPGVGSTFGFVVKFTPGNPANVEEVVGLRQQAAALAAPPRPTRQLRVLVAEDTDTIRFLVTTVLSRMGHSVTAVNDGLAAVEQFQRGGYDIILMDMQMPVMEGPGAMRAIRLQERASAHIPIIALTADALRENRASYLEAGADTIVIKPIDWARLFTEMERFTGAPDSPPPSLESEPHSISAYVRLNSPAILDAAAIDVLKATFSPAEFERFMTRFLASILDHKRRLENDLAVADYGRFKSTLHSLKGLCAQAGAEEVARVSAEIETNTTGIGDIHQFLPRLMGCILRLQMALETGVIRTCP